MRDRNEDLAHSALNLPAQDADKLLAVADGVCALLYIYLLRGGGFDDPAGTARTLRCSEREVLDAAERLRAMELSAVSLNGARSAAPVTHLPPPDGAAEYSSEEISGRTASDPAFAGLVAETQRVMGRLLSGTDLRILFGLYDRLGLQPETILLLVNHCAERARKRYGEGRAPTLRAIEKEAYIWANREIRTLEQAEAHLAALAAREADSYELCRVLGLRGREPSASERRYMDSWLELGFSPEALAIAYDRTVLGTGKLTWRYMDSIVRSWHSKGLHTPDEIEAGDTRTAPAPRSGRSSTARPESVNAPADDDLSRLERLLKG
ncbi:MAG: DnaD domain protein [Eubacteriales bacterium]|nr:DnaD domain protein [Eubacteriales bacterium]